MSFYVEETLPSRISKKLVFKLPAQVSQEKIEGETTEEREAKQTALKQTQLPQVDVSTDT